MKPLTTGGLLAASALLVLTGCGGGSGNAAPSTSTSAPPSTAPSSTAPSSAAPSGAATEAAASVLMIKDYKYTGPASVKAGATVTVKNDDSVNHTVTADGKGGFDVTVQANSTKTFTAPSTPGSYPYHCTYHSNMHGTLKVT